MIMLPLRSFVRQGWSSPRGEGGSALVVVLMTLAVLVVVAGTLLSYTTSKQAAPFQAASWHEAGSAAEGGVELALSSLRRSLQEGDSAWGGWAPPGAGDPSFLYRKYLTEGDLLSHDGEGNRNVRAVVEVTVPTGANTINPPENGVPLPPERLSYLIRATGIANVPGPARLPLAKPDQMLRKLNFISDSRTRNRVENGLPQVARVVEAIAVPVTPFPLAIHAREEIEIKSGDTMVVDSYDPAAPAVDYSNFVPVRKANGSIGTNLKHDNHDVIRLENVTIYGNAAKGEGIVKIETPASVTGTIQDGFYRAMANVQRPIQNPKFASGNLQSLPTKAGDRKTADIQAGKGPVGNNPAETLYYKLDKVHLHEGETLKIKKGNPEGGYAAIWVAGNITLHNGGSIDVEKGANAIIYCDKDVTIEEKDYNKTAIKNNAVKRISINGNPRDIPDPEALQFYGSSPERKKKHFKIKSNMVGLVFAPEHEFEVELKKSGVPSGKPPRAIYGSLAGRKFKIKGATQVHYDESLGVAGKPYDYTIESWQEDWFNPTIRP